MKKNLDLTDFETHVQNSKIANLARVDNIYIASELQDKEAINWLKQNSVTTFIDLKNPEETAYSDQEMVGDAQYFSCPFPGVTGVDHEYLEQINQILEQSSGNICVYCKSGNRVIAWMVLHLLCLQGHNKKKVLEWAAQFPFFRETTAQELKNRLELV